MNKYYKNQLLLGIIFAVILIPVSLIFLSSAKPQKAFFTNHTPSNNIETTDFIHYAWDSNPHFVPKKISLAYLNFRVNYFKTHPYTKDSIDIILKLAEKHLTSEDAKKIKSRIYTEF